MSVTDNNPEKYDVGIFGWWYNRNYGANLTYYSLNRAIQKLGYSVVMLWRSSKQSSSVTLPEVEPLRFACAYYNISPKHTKSELHKHNDICNCFVLGSDQLWNPDLERVAGEEFFLSFADDEKVKLAYAQSFGNHVTLKEPFKEKYKKLLDRFDGISVREDSGVELFKNEFNMTVPQVCDPVFLSPVEEYSKLAGKADVETPSKYVLNFILDPTDEKIEACREIRKKLGIEEYINLTDLHDGEKKAEKFLGEKVLHGTSIENFVYAYKNADYIVTDSFHGTCMAIIFNKPFISIANKFRGVRRFESLLTWLNLKNRLYYDVKKLHTEMPVETPDFAEANKKIESAREFGLNWLKEGIEKGSNIARRLPQKLCTGCSACVSVCPSDALSLAEDEYGYYRCAVDTNKCTRCKKCINVCPALNDHDKTNDNTPTCYAVQASDDPTLYASSSGGAFSLIAGKVLENDGLIFGAAWRDDFSVHHISVDNWEDLSKLRKSKYLQSFLGNTFREIKKELDSNRKVLFSGCPCQVAGLQSYLGKSYDDLITVDVLCGNAPSATFFKEYLMDNFENLSAYEFRYKAEGGKPGWRDYAVKVKYEDGSEAVLKGLGYDEYQRPFHSHILCPEHCEKCKYQSLPRYGDITIGDFWGIEKKLDVSGTEKGISVVLCNNKKGLDLITGICDDKFALKKEVPVDWLGGNGYAVSGTNFAPHGRNLFYKAIKKKGFNDAVNYALKPNHGMYRDIYSENDSVLQYDSRQLHFKYESNIWEEHFINGYHTLMVKVPLANPGHYATLSLCKTLKKGKEYVLKIRFRILSRSNILNLHIKDSGSRSFQLLKTCKINEKNNGNEWLEYEIPFIPDTNFYDEFMIGAAQVIGESNYIAFDYIFINSKE